eukprot:m.264061 g.264061  ORF g.264061 m.264061 type:complete len:1851 (-) comp16021_c0_seq1:2623-8175(-)
MRGGHAAVLIVLVGRVALVRPFRLVRLEPTLPAEDQGPGEPVAAVAAPSPLCVGKYICGPAGPDAIAAGWTASICSQRCNDVDSERRPTFCVDWGDQGSLDATCVCYCDETPKAGALRSPADPISREKRAEEAPMTDGEDNTEAPTKADPYGQDDDYGYAPPTVPPTAAPTCASVYNALASAGCCRDESGGVGSFTITMEESVDACKALCDSSGGCYGVETAEVDGLIRCERHWNPNDFHHTTTSGTCVLESTCSKRSCASSSAPSATPTLTQAPTAAPKVASTAPTLAPKTSKPSGAPTHSTTTPTQSPSVHPTSTPTIPPTDTPSFLPTTTPTPLPSAEPTQSPSVRPSPTPTSLPSFLPTAVPTESPSVAPTQPPSDHPTQIPSTPPTLSPSFPPTATPTQSPSDHPTPTPTVLPTYTPSFLPTTIPTERPSASPTQRPSVQPTPVPTALPTNIPSFPPTTTPTHSPSLHPTSTPTISPTHTPSFLPTPTPTAIPSAGPTQSPSVYSTSPPTNLPSYTPSSLPTTIPTELPSASPTQGPSGQPTPTPTTPPTKSPSLPPTTTPTRSPSDPPTPTPTTLPTHTPSFLPTTAPTELPSAAPAQPPSPHPTPTPTSPATNVPSTLPTTTPTQTPSVHPTPTPTTLPTNTLSFFPTTTPTALPSAEPTRSLSAHPTPILTGPPTEVPSLLPTITPSAASTESPSVHASPPVAPTTPPTKIPTGIPTTTPTDLPSAAPTRPPPTALPTLFSSSGPTLSPSVHPTTTPTNVMSYNPSFEPTTSPTSLPSTTPTRVPSFHPTPISISAVPTQFPTVRPTKSPLNAPTSFNPTVDSTTTPAPHSETRPTQLPSFLPITPPTAAPITRPLVEPTQSPSASPTRTPTMLSTRNPSFNPATSPTMLSTRPTLSPTVFPFSSPTARPTSLSSAEPTQFPSPQSGLFTHSPTPTEPTAPTADLPTSPSAAPSVIPTAILSPMEPPTPSSSEMPSISPTFVPFRLPTVSPTTLPMSDQTSSSTAATSPVFSTTTIPVTTTTAIPEISTAGPAYSGTTIPPATSTPSILSPTHVEPEVSLSPTGQSFSSGPSLSLVFPGIVLSELTSTQLEDLQNQTVNQIVDPLGVTLRHIASVTTSVGSVVVDVCFHSNASLNVTRLQAFAASVVNGSINITINLGVDGRPEIAAVHARSSSSCSASTPSRAPTISIGVSTHAPTPGYINQSEADSSQSSNDSYFEIMIALAMVIILLIFGFATVVIFRWRRKGKSTRVRQVSVSIPPDGICMQTPSISQRSAIVRLDSTKKRRGLEVWADFLRAVAFDFMYFNNPLLQLNDDALTRILIQFRIPCHEHRLLYARLRKLGSAFLQQSIQVDNAKVMNEVVDFLDRAVVDVLFERALDVYCHFECERLRLEADEGSPQYAEPVPFEACYAEVDYDQMRRRSYVSMADKESLMYAQIDEFVAGRNPYMVETDTGIYVTRDEVNNDQYLYPKQSTFDGSPNYATCPDVEHLFGLYQELPKKVDITRAVTAVEYASDAGVYDLAINENVEPLYEEPCTGIERITSKTSNHSKPDTLIVVPRTQSHPDVTYEEVSGGFWPLRGPDISSGTQDRLVSNNQTAIPGVVVDRDGYCVLPPNAVTNTVELYTAEITPANEYEYTDNPPKSTIDSHRYEYDDERLIVPKPPVTKRRQTAYDVFLDPPSQNSEQVSHDHSYEYDSAPNVMSSAYDAFVEHPQQISSTPISMDKANENGQGLGIYMALNPHNAQRLPPSPGRRRQTPASFDVVVDTPAFTARTIRDGANEQSSSDDLLSEATANTSPVADSTSPHGFAHDSPNGHLMADGHYSVQSGNPTEPTSNTRRSAWS